MSGCISRATLLFWCKCASKQHLSHLWRGHVQLITLLCASLPPPRAPVWWARVRMTASDPPRSGRVARVRSLLSCLFFCLRIIHHAGRHANQHVLRAQICMEAHDLLIYFPLFAICDGEVSSAADTDQWGSCRIRWTNEAVIENDIWKTCTLWHLGKSLEFVKNQNQIHLIIWAVMF